MIKESIMKEKMIQAFKEANGGMFSSVEKADVGDAYQKMKEAGVDLMGWADPFMPDKSLPKHVEEALIEAIKDASSAHYTAPIGNQVLKEALAKRLKAFNGLDVDPYRNILITPGSDSGLYYAMLPFIDVDDEVIIFTPSYPNNFTNVKIMSGKIVPVLLKEEDKYQINEEALRSSISSKTKMIVITHPNNPTTTVFNQQSLMILRDVVVEFDLVLVCDQAFEDFCFENEFITPATLPDMFERTITVFSISKGMGLSGLRVGYIVCADEVMDKLHANAVSVIGATNTASQHATIAALSDMSFMRDFEIAYNIRRIAAYRILNSIPNVSMFMPESGFLAWVNVSKLGNSSEIVNYLVKEAKVAVNDGINYGPGGEGHLRIVLGVYKDNHKVIDALERIKVALIKYQEK